MFEHGARAFLAQHHQPLLQAQQERDGSRGRLSAALGRYRAGPGGLGQASLGTPSGSLRPLRISGPPCGARVRRFWERCEAAAFRFAPCEAPRPAMCLSAVAASAPLLGLRRQRSQRASWTSSHPLSFQAPVAPRETVNGPIHVPSQATTRQLSHGAGRAGISAPLAAIPQSLVNVNARAPVSDPPGPTPFLRHRCCAMVSDPGCVKTSCLL